MPENVTPTTASQNTNDSSDKPQSNVSVADAVSTRDVGDALGGQPNAGTPATKIADGATAAEIRELGDGDMDAMVTTKVNGQVKKITVREAIKRAQLAEATEERLAKAKGRERQVEQAYQQLQALTQLAHTNPQKYFELTGQDPYAASEKILSERLRIMEMSPEERRLYEWEQKLQKQDETVQEHQARMKQEADQRAESQYMEQADREIGEALKSTQMPKRAFYVQQIAAQVSGALARGETLSMQEAAAIIKDKFVKEALGYVKSLPVDQLREILGQENLKKIREDDVARLHNPGSRQPAGQGTPPASNRKPATKVFKSDADYRAWVESLKVS